MDDIQNLLVAGDTHGRQNWIKWLCRLKNDHDFDAILQVGDFGFWEHAPHGRAFLDDVNRLLEKSDLELYFCDGNHENHEFLREYPITESGRNTGMAQIRERIWYLPRGHVWDWNGVSFLSLGGASSIDRARRTINDSWWPQELITDDEVSQAIGNIGDQYVNVMITHDCPEGVSIPTDDGNTSLKNFEPETVINRRKLIEVVREARPELLFHGHYHVRYSDVLEDYGCDRPIRIEGLGRDGDMRGGWVILDLPSLRVHQ